MSRQSLGVRRQVRYGKPIHTAGVEIRGEVHSSVIGSPFGGFALNRPTGVLLRYGNQTWRLPIRDVTWYVQLALIGLALVLVATRGSRTR